MLRRTRPAEANPLLADLLEASGRIYHRHVAAIQQVFTAQFLGVLHDHVGRAQIEFPDAHPVSLEARVRAALGPYQAELRRLQDLLIAEERCKREQRDRGIRAYVSAAACPPRAA